MPHPIYSQFGHSFRGLCQYRKESGRLLTSGTIKCSSRKVGMHCAEPLIKPVVARAGDVVKFSSQGISVNGSLIKNTAPLYLDGANRPLTHWEFGVYRVVQGEVWVASTYNYGSYDSRYFDPVRISSIRNRLCLIWTLHQ
jgi:type IV secretory pathway protease TraF